MKEKMADPLSHFHNEEWIKAMKVLPKEDKEYLKKHYKYNQDSNAWLSSRLKTQSDIIQIRLIKNKIANHKEAPKEAPKTQTKRKKGAVSAAPKEYTDAVKFWTKTYRKHHEIKKKSPEYLQGITIGIAEDNRINKTELPAWAAARHMLKKKGVALEVKKPKNAAPIPELDNNVKQVLMDKTRNEVKKKEKTKQTTKKKGGEKSTVPEKPKTTSKRRTSKSTSEKFEEWKNNFGAFGRAFGLIGKNAAYRKQLCEFIEQHGTEKHKARAKAWGLKWKKWWVVPIDKKTGQPYVESNKVSSVLPKGTTIADLEAEYRRKYKK